MNISKKMIVVMIMALILSTSSFAYYSGYPLTISESLLGARTYDLYIWNSSSGYWVHSTVTGESYIADNLKAKEFVSYSDTYGKLYSPNVVISTTFISSWNSLRALYSPLIVNAGYRSNAHNKKVNGVAQSQHKAGVAADVKTPSGLTDSQFNTAATNAGFEHSEIISGGGAVHMDERELPSGQTSGYPTISSLGSYLYAITIQDGLITNDYNCVFTGFYGSITKNDVEDFQSDNGLTVDGIVGSNTWNEFHYEVGYQ
ncbi:MAG: peptidoglycan-binding protein [Clostridiales bacterium]|nr:peptidoglycan-binding protein [Clostridiales bacterium]